MVHHGSHVFEIPYYYPIISNIFLNSVVYLIIVAKRVLVNRNYPVHRIDYFSAVEKAVSLFSNSYNPLYTYYFIIIVYRYSVVHPHDDNV